MREATHGIDGLLSDVLLGGGIVLNDLAILGVEAFSDAIDLFVNLRSVMVAFLADASDRESNTRRMPSTNTGNLAKTLVSLTRQLFDVPTSNNTFDSVTLGDADDVNHLILAENILDRNRLLQQPASKVDLLWNGAAVELDFVDVGLLLSLLKKLDLSVGDDADDGAVFLHLGKILFDLLLAIFSRPLLGVLGEGLLLGLVPVLVEASSAFFGQMLGPDGLEGSHPVWGLNVADDTDHHDRRGFDDGDGFNNFLLVDLGPRTIDHTANVGHTSLVTGEGGEMNRFLRVVLREGLDTTLVVLAPLLGEESQVAVTRGGKLPVRHDRLKNPI